jgi:hypothetical protein
MALFGNSHFVTGFGPDGRSNELPGFTMGSLGKVMFCVGVHSLAALYMLWIGRDTPPSSHWMVLSAHHNIHNMRGARKM